MVRDPMSINCKQVSSQITGHVVPTETVMYLRVRKKSFIYLISSVQNIKGLGLNKANNFYFLTKGVIKWYCYFSSFLFHYSECVRLKNTITTIGLISLPLFFSKGLAILFNIVFRPSILQPSKKGKWYFYI